MFTIGEFAAYAQVSVRMLRHYDHLCLLPPAHVDPRTGYRFYSASQLPRLQQILTLNDLGIRLDRIGPLLDEHPAGAGVQRALEELEARLETSLAEDRRRLEQVHELMAAGGTPRPCLRVTTRARPRITAAVLRERVADQTALTDSVAINGIYDRLGRELIGRLRAAGVAQTGRQFTFADREPAPGPVTFHMAIPVGLEAGAADQDVEVVGFPAVDRAATVVTDGTGEQIEYAHHVLFRWVHDHGGLASGPTRNVVLAIEHDRPGGTVTRLVMQHELPYTEAC